MAESCQGYSRTRWPISPPVLRTVSPGDVIGDCSFPILDSGLGDRCLEVNAVRKIWLDPIVPLILFLRCKSTIDSSQHFPAKIVVPGKLVDPDTSIPTASGGEQ